MHTLQVTLESYFTLPLVGKVLVDSFYREYSSVKFTFVLKHLQNTYDRLFTLWNWRFNEATNVLGRRKDSRLKRNFFSLNLKTFSVVHAAHKIRFVEVFHAHAQFHIRDVFATRAMASKLKYGAATLPVSCTRNKMKEKSRVCQSQRFLLLKGK